MPHALFTPGRADGRSDKRVIFDLTHHEPRGTIFSFADLEASLEVGLEPDEEVTRPRIYKAVAEANAMLLRTDQRVLQSVKGIGYRLALASDHSPLAVSRKTRAELQIRKGLEILHGTDVNELTPLQRNERTGNLLIFGGLIDQMRDYERRVRRNERAIEKDRQANRQVLSELEERLKALEAEKTQEQDAN